MGVGQHTTVAELNDDWTMTHEFIHTAFPDLPDEHHWIEEGLAVYVEPIARVQHGHALAGRRLGRHDQEHAQGRARPRRPRPRPRPRLAEHLLGGARFFLVADVRIREQTHNRIGLQDALRAILNAGSIEIDSTPEPAFAIGDHAVGGRVLEDLYAACAMPPCSRTSTHSGTSSA